MPYYSGKQLSTIPRNFEHLEDQLKGTKTIDVLGSPGYTMRYKGSVKPVFYICHYGKVVGELTTSTPTKFEGPQKKVIVTHLFSIHKDHIGMGLGSNVYRTLVEMGYSILSDKVHFEGGKKLWKNIIKKAPSWEAKVLIVKNGKIETNSRGEPIQVTTETQEDKIWPFMSILLLLTKNENI